MHHLYYKIVLVKLYTCYILTGYIVFISKIFIYTVFLLMYMEARKIQVVGNRSYSVSLPKSWVTTNKLKAKDTIFIETLASNDLLVRSSDKSVYLPSELAFNIDDIVNIQEFLVFCYVKNIDNLKLFTKRMDFHKIAAIREVLKYLEGYDITNENERSIEISFLFKDVNVTISKIIRRMTYLLHLEYEAIRNKDYKTIDDTEIAIDRLYHLSKRIIFACMRNSKLRKENAIVSDEDLFFYKDIIKRLEKMGDEMVRLKDSPIHKEDLAWLERLIRFIQELLCGRKDATKMRGPFEKLKPYSEKKESNKVLASMYSLTRDLFQSKVSIEFNKRYFS